MEIKGISNYQPLMSSYIEGERKIQPSSKTVDLYTNRNDNDSYNIMLRNQLDNYTGLEVENIYLNYKLYGDKHNKVAVEIVDKDTGEVIREVPPEEYQNLQAYIDNLIESKEK